MPSGHLIVPGAMPSRDSNGRAVRGRLYFYEPGTTDLATVYTTALLSTALTNPVLSDAAGRFVTIWADQSDTFDVAWEKLNGEPVKSYSDISPTLDAQLASVAMAEAAQERAEDALDTIQAILEGHENIAVQMFTFLGDWSAVYEYSAGDAVLSANSTYVSLVDGNLNEAPAGSASWQLLAGGGNLASSSGPGTPLAVNSTDSTFAKIDLQDAGVSRGRIGASATGVAIQDADGEIIGFFLNTADAVNYLLWQSSATGVAVVMRPGGADTNITTRIEQKGSGYVGLATNESVRVYTDQVQIGVPTRPGNYTVAARPANVLTGAISQINDAGGGPSLMIQGGTYLRRVDQPSVQRVLTDAPFTLTYLVDSPIVRHGGTLTANRLVTLSTVGVIDGATFEITRQGAGAFNLDIGGLKNLAVNTWCVVKYDVVATAWYLHQYGAL